MPRLEGLGMHNAACYGFRPFRKDPSMPSEAIQCRPLEVVVSDRGIERAIKMLKRKLASEGVLRELKMRRHYMKPSVKRRKKQAEAARRRRKRAKMDQAPPKAS
jgi:small subunit ribosomal protein S21